MVRSKTTHLSVAPDGNHTVGVSSGEDRETTAVAMVLIILYRIHPFSNWVLDVDKNYGVGNGGVGTFLYTNTLRTRFGHTLGHSNSLTAPLGTGLGDLISTIHC